MIDVKELRCGNILQYYIGEEGVDWDYTRMDAADIVWCEGKPENFNKVHRAVELSSELLEKIGFTHIVRKVDLGISGFFPEKTWFIPDGETVLRNTSYPNFKNGFYLGAYKNKTPFYFSNYRHETIGTEITFLHDLQNLWFCLYKTELIIPEL